MKKHPVALLAAAATLAVFAVGSADPSAAKKKAAAPESQSDTAVKGESSSGAASGERGAGTANAPGSQQQMEAWDQTYQSDIAQEKQLKVGGNN